MQAKNAHTTERTPLRRRLDEMPLGLAPLLIAGTSEFTLNLL